ncbi:uncharacterized protein LOC129616980 [Condylostylus longicornis]|uniref:uncharacterized protein LOC129616980 n=1 Tax=Condylostylus longicornis TaxID=2530218 RepID=UPI00244DE82D|nr:uncharacterized protein LOC129616980 [Condylostylus longicornis]
MLLGFIIGILDPSTLGVTVLPVAIAYALCSAVFRAWCLEKAMHVVEGQGNTLHNHQVAMGIIVLPFIALACGETKVFNWMPTNFSQLFTWQSWGTLVSAGTIPFIKNVVANRMIRRTGQAPWRILEAISMILVFAIGATIWDTTSIASIVAFSLVLAGRVLGTLDVLSKDPDERRRAVYHEAEHESYPPPTLGFSEDDYENIEMCEGGNETGDAKYKLLSKK